MLKEDECEQAFFQTTNRGASPHAKTWNGQRIKKQKLLDSPREEFNGRIPRQLGLHQGSCKFNMLIAFIISHGVCGQPPRKIFRGQNDKCVEDEDRSHLG